MSQSSDPGADALWRDRDFGKLWSAAVVSAFGARITREGLPMAAALTLRASPGEIGLLAALSYGPALFAGLAAGPVFGSRRPSNKKLERRSDSSHRNPL